MTTVNLEYHDMLSELYAKVCFDQYMSEFSKESLKRDWEKFKRRVDKALEIVETPDK